MIVEKESKMQIINSGDVTYLTSSILSKLDWVQHGISTRKGGVSEGFCESMNLAKKKPYDTYENIKENYYRFSRAVNINPDMIVSMGQVHQDNIEVVDENHICLGVSENFDFDDTDGMVTDIPGISLFGYTADCPLVLIADDKNHAIGICHSGWRGTVKEISSKLIEKMKNKYNSKPDDMYAFIAPSICQNCFEVSEDVILEINKIVKEDKRKDVYYRKENGKYQLNLWETIKISLVNSGIKSENIELPHICSKCNTDYFFSHRYQGEKRGTGAAYIMIK